MVKTSALPCDRIEGKVAMPEQFAGQCRLNPPRGPAPTHGIERRNGTIGRRPMADTTNGNGGAADAEQPQPIEVQVVGQFIRDLSFVNPSVGKLLDGPGENPNLKIEVNVNAHRAEGDLFESAI